MVYTDINSHASPTIIVISFSLRNSGQRGYMAFPRSFYYQVPELEFNLRTL